MSETQSQFKSILKNKGLKVTAQRIAVLEALSDRPDMHLTAEEIYDLVRRQYPEIGLATIYRTAQLLSELNLIEKLNLGDGYVRYEIGKGSMEENGHHHHHLICLGCRTVISFEDDLLDALEQKIQDSKGFLVVDHEVKLYGYCKNCAAKSDKEQEARGQQ